MTNAKHHPIVVPEFGIADQPIRLSLWLVKRGRTVAEGEPVVELLCGGITVDLSAPISGVLIEKNADEDDEVQVGQTLGVMEITNCI